MTTHLKAPADLVGDETAHRFPPEREGTPAAAWGTKFDTYPGRGATFIWPCSVVPQQACVWRIADFPPKSV